MHDETFVREVMVFLVAVGRGGAVARSPRIRPLLGFLLVGLAIGPSGVARLGCRSALFSVSIVMSIDLARSRLSLSGCRFGDRPLPRQGRDPGPSHAPRRPAALGRAAVCIVAQPGRRVRLLTFGFSLLAGLLPNNTAQFMLIVRGLTMVATPLVARGARRLARM